MKKQLMTLVGVLSVMLAAGPALAQTVHVRSNIPFNFVVDKATLPAGQYDVRTVSAGTDSILLLSGLDTHANAMIGSNDIESSDASNETKLVFDHVGDRYFLRQIWVEGETAGREFPKTKYENELASIRMPDRVVVMARLK